MKKSYMKYFAALILFGSNGVVASNINLSSYEIVLLRSIIGSLMLALLFVFTRQRVTFLKHKKDLFFVALSGTSMGVCWMFMYEAYVQIGVSLTSLLYYTGPVIVMVLSPIIFKEKLTLNKIIGFIIVLIGVCFVNGNMIGAKGNDFGVMCGFIAAIMYAVTVIASKKSGKIVGMENAAIQLVSSFVIVAIFIGIKGEFNMHIQSSDWIWVIILGVINTGFACYLYFSSIGGLPVQTVAICGYFEPLSAVLFSVVFLQETMLPMQILGGIMIISGAVFGELIKDNKKCVYKNVEGLQFK
ncbi:MAG: EamA family transporter [Clostridium sp.]